MNIQILIYKICTHMEAYLKEIEQLIAENQVVKDQNRKLKRACNQLLADMRDFFQEFYPQVSPYKQATFDTLLFSMLPYYRKELLALRLDFKTSFDQILRQYQCELPEDDTISYVQSQLIGQFKQAMIGGKVCLKNKLDVVMEEKKTLEGEIRIWENRVSGLELEIKRKEMGLEERQAEISRRKSEIQLLQVENQSLQHSLQASRNRYEALRLDYTKTQEQVNQLDLMNQNLRNQIINNYKEPFYPQ